MIISSCSALICLSCSRRRLSWLDCLWSGSTGQLLKVFWRILGSKGHLIAICWHARHYIPLFVVLPMASDLYKKGAKLAVVLTYLGASAICRIPMTIFEATFLGVRFTIVRYAVSLAVDHPEFRYHRKTDAKETGEGGLKPGVHCQSKRTTAEKPTIGRATRGQ